MEIIPQKGVGPFLIGMSRHDVRKHINFPYVSIKLVPWNKFDSDICDELGLHFTYNEDEKLEFINLNFKSITIIGS